MKSYSFPVCSQLQQAEDNLKADQTGIEELKEEFTKRISTSEKKLQAVIKVYTFVYMYIRMYVCMYVQYVMCLYVCATVCRIYIFCVSCYVQIM